MMRLRILADDLTGALDCAAAFGAGAPVHLGQPASLDSAGLDIVATATRDVPVASLSTLLRPSLAWFSQADVAFKKVDSLLRGNTFDEVDWLARQAHFRGVAMVPAFPAQGRLTEEGQQWWHRPDGEKTAVAASIRDNLQARGWTVVDGLAPPALKTERLAWVPNVRSQTELDAVADHALPGSGWLWCGSAGLAHALARKSSQHAMSAGASGHIATQGEVMLVSASHHAVTRAQWRVLSQSPWGRLICQADDPQALQPCETAYSMLFDLSSQTPLTQAQAAALLAQQIKTLVNHAPRPRVLVVVGGDTLLAMCMALGAHGLRSEVPLARPGWGCARMLGGRWDGLVCHTRSGAFGDSADLLQTLDSL